MKPPLSMRIGHSNADVASALNEATAWLADPKPPAAAEFFIRLAIEELGTNWIKYGAKDSPEGFMTLELFHGNDALTLKTTDPGCPFNPLDVPPPQTELPPEQREPGGLGILLLRKMADRMSYERRDGLNIITVEKSTSHSQA